MTKPKCILLDIEGTTSSISFVYDDMFPYVREHLSTFLDCSWDDGVVQDCLPLLAKDLGYESLGDWLEEDPVQAQLQVKAGVIQLMDDDVKATGLKKLQGAVWKDGFESKQLVAHLFDDVAPAIKNWKAAGIEVRIYSSGSIEAQKLFFGHSVAGNLLPLFGGHYDTTIGSKKERDSYVAIAADSGCMPSEILFVSDVTDELDAAASASMNTVLSIRPGNKNVEDVSRYNFISSFDQIHFVGASV